MPLFREVLLRSRRGSCYLSTNLLSLPFLDHASRHAQSKSEVRQQKAQIQVGTNPSLGQGGPAQKPLQRT